MLLVAAYGLVNTGAKWQKHSDETFFEIGMKVVVQVPQLFYKIQNGELTLIAAKVNDNILLAGSEENAKHS